MTDGPATHSPHLDRELLDSYMIGERSVVDLLRSALGHLTDEPLGDPRQRGAEVSRTGRLLQAAMAGLQASVEEVKREHEAVPGLAEELLSLDFHDSSARVRRDRRYHTLSFLEYCVDVAWVSLEQGLVVQCHQAVELGRASLPGVDPARYHRFLRAEAEANLWLLTGRAELALGQAENARASFEEATLLGHRAGPARELRTGLLLASAADLVARGRRRSALGLLEEASRLGPRGTADRWWPAIQAGTAWLERSSGRPEAAAARLRRFFDSWDARMITRSEWWAARELVASLCEMGELEEASAHLASWSDGQSTAGRSGGEMAYLGGFLLRRMGGDPELADSTLERAGRLFLAADRGVDSALVFLEVFRSHRERGAEIRDWTPSLSGASLCRDVTPPVFAALARFAEGALRDRATDEDLREIETLLTAARAGWGPAVANHGSP